MSSDAATASSSTSNGDAPAVQEQSHPYTLETLKAHGTREDLWMLLHGKVYNVTKFLDEHPGGDEVMIEEAGKDATEAFEDVGHSDEARAMLPKMLLGDFHGESTEKKVKRAVSATGSAAASGGGFTYLIPLLVLVAAYFGWRLFLA